MGFLDDLLVELPTPVDSEPGWDELRRARPELLAKYQEVVEWYRALGDEPHDEVDPRVVQGARQQLANLYEAFRLVTALRSGAEFFIDHLRSMQQSVDGAVAWWRTDGRIQIRGREVDLAVMQVEVRRLLEDVRSGAAEVAEVRAQVAKDAEEVKSLEVAQHYAQKADSHGLAAWVALALLLAGVVLLAVAGGRWVYDIRTDDVDASWPVFVREVLLRVFVLGTLSYAIVFAVRVYRTNMHLKAVYDQKATALKTFVLFSKTLTPDDEARTLILAELVRAVFAPAETGVLDKSGSERTVIDSAPAVAAALSSVRATSGR